MVVIIILVVGIIIFVGGSIGSCLAIVVVVKVDTVSVFWRLMTPIGGVMYGRCSFSGQLKVSSMFGSLGFDLLIAVLVMVGKTLMAF